MRMDLSGFILVPIGIELVNLGLLFVLMHIFWKNYRRLKSSFTRGLLLFSIAFFLKSIMNTGYILIIAFNVISDEHMVGGILPFGFNVFESIALIMLIRVTNE